MDGEMFLHSVSEHKIRSKIFILIVSYRFKQRIYGR